VVLLLDNYDSFTYNLVQCLQQLGAVVRVLRHDRIDAAEVGRLGPDRILLSPGPGDPSQSGICPQVVQRFAGHIPILGVCLGHQVIAQCFGAAVVPAPRVVHGRTSKIFHDGRGLFSGLPRSFSAMRYHSLVVGRRPWPDCLEVTARTSDGLVMGLRHRHYRLEGVQFHPESILTPQGEGLLANFLRL
jgi:para-aminobenzoate synthetase component II